MPAKNTPDLRRAAFNRAIGERRRVTISRDGGTVLVRESAQLVSRAIFLFWKRDGWIRELSFRRGSAVYEVVRTLELVA